jgi:hypothetical protein
MLDGRDGGALGGGPARSCTRKECVGKVGELTAGPLQGEWGYRDALCSGRCSLACQRRCQHRTNASKAKALAKVREIQEAGDTGSSNYRW